MPNSRSAEDSRAEHLEEDFRLSIRDAIKDTRESVASINSKVGLLSDKFEQMDRANERQHSELGVRVDQAIWRVDELAQKWAADQKLLVLKYEQAFEIVNEKLKSKNVIIRGCLAVILLLVGILLEAKFKISEALKLLGVGG